MKNSYMGELNDLKLIYYKEYFQSKETFNKYMMSLIEDMRVFIEGYDNMKYLEMKLDNLNNKLKLEVGEDSEEKCENFSD